MRECLFKRKHNRITLTNIGTALRTYNSSR